MYPVQTCYVIGEAKSPENNPITKTYQSFFIGFVVDMESDIIIDAECTTMMDLTQSFVRHLFIGRNILDYEGAADVLKKRYFGSSQKAMAVAFKHAGTKYKEATK